MRPLLFTLLLVIVLTRNCDGFESKCNGPDDVECHEKEKYLKEKNEDSNNDKWKHILKKIDQALHDYQECSSQNCSCYLKRLQADLEPWKERGIDQNLIKKASKVERTSYYQILNKKLYRRDKDEMFPSRSSGVEHFLLEIIDRLPNTEFVLNTKDWPQTTKWKRNEEDKLPIFSFSKVDRENYDIMYPNWAFWEGGPSVWPIYPGGLGRWDKQLKMIQNEAKKQPWRKKQTKGFFRGSRTTPERDPLILLSRKEPTLVDAQYTKNQAWRSDADTLGAKPAEEIKLEEHCKYKYLFNFRGVAASFRFRHLFLCNSLVFHVGAEWLEFFYDELKPWIHYIPVRQDLSDARELLEFAIENDEVAKEIAERGKRFIVEHLRMDDVTCYWQELLTEYTKLLKYEVKKKKNFIEIQKKQKK